MASKQDSTGGTTPVTGEAEQAVAGVGGVRSSDDPAPDLWFGQPSGGSEGTPLVPQARSAGKDVVTACEG